MIQLQSTIFRFAVRVRKSHQILGVKAQASAAEIKAAYYGLAKIYHPDARPGSSAHQFSEIQNAYQQLLSKQRDTRSKKVARQECEKGHRNAKRSGPSSQSGDASFADWHKYKQEWEQQCEDDEIFGAEFLSEEKELKDFEKGLNSFLRNGYLKGRYRKYGELIGQLFGQTPFYEDLFHRSSGTSKQAQRHSKPKGTNKVPPNTLKIDLSQTVYISPQEIGSDKLVTLSRLIICHRCSFERQKNYHKHPCAVCQKSGTVGYSKVCKKCEGRGFILSYSCKTCNNAGSFRKSSQQVISIPLGISNRQRIVLKGRGNQDYKSGKYGDMIITCILQNNNQISNQISLNIFEAVLGLSTIYQTTQGKRILKIPPGAQSGEVFNLEANHSHQRHPNSNITIEESVKVNVKIPLSITHQEREIYEKLQQMSRQKSGLFGDC